MAEPTDEPVADALRLQRQAAAEGFDWTDAEGLWDKLAEETGELRRAASQAERAEELGDLLFMVVNLARHLGVDPRTALAAANRKFRRRFAYIMAHVHKLPPAGDPARLERMEALWQQAKRLERESAVGNRES
ncbi:MAG: MazG family protein [Nevskia sp.]|nr:MazG family protein [Nevskia sp.]